MLRSWALVLAMFLSVAVAHAGEPKTVPSGAAIFIEPMENDLDGYIRAEMVKKKIPLKIVLKREQAHLVMSGESATRKGSWHEGWLSMEKDKASGSAMVVDRATGEMLWAAEAGDRSLFWGSFSKGGPRKVASRIVGNLKKVIFTSPPLGDPPPLTDDERAQLSAETAPVAALFTQSAGAADPDIAAEVAEQPTDGAGEAAASVNPMTNQDVERLASAGLGEDVILAKIHSGPTDFSLETDSILRLKEAGVSDRVLAAMIEASDR